MVLVALSCFAYADMVRRSAAPTSGDDATYSANSPSPSTPLTQRPLV
jgi:hypothetical protein